MTTLKHQFGDLTGSRRRWWWLGDWPWSLEEGVVLAEVSAGSSPGTTPGWSWWTSTWTLVEAQRRLDHSLRSYHYHNFLFPGLET